MSNYRKGYFDVLQLDRPLTPKQRRRTNKKTARDLRNLGGHGNPNPPASLSGHPGRRRAQLAERRAVAEEKAIARALRRAERESAGRQSAADIVHAQSGGGS